MNHIKTYTPTGTAAFLLTAISTLWLVGCGGGAGKTSSDSPSPVSEITIEGTDMMRFRPAQFAVRADSDITLTLSNVGTMPKESMGHNLVILRADASPMVYAAAAVLHSDKQYLPPEFADRVVAATPVLGPGENHVLKLTAPSEPGAYPFLCSFPGHTEAGMRGIMHVVK